LLALAANVGFHSHIDYERWCGRLAHTRCSLLLVVNE
jgi:hypothetical protein